MIQPMKSILFSFISILLLVIACEPSGQEKAQQDRREQEMQRQATETTPQFNEQITSVMDRYFDLKDALVESDAEQAKITAESLKRETEDVHPEDLGRETLDLWRSYREVIQNSSDALVNRDDIVEQRYHFEFISEAMIDMVKTFRPAGFSVYHQSCPMVRNGSADWLSRQEQIANPYHGARMISCGKTIRKIS